MAKKKFYVVWKGRETGVFDNWEECTNQIHSFKDAKYKSFKTKEEAQVAFKGKYEDYKGKDVCKVELSTEELEKIGQPNLDSISVDAACSGNPGLMEYQGVETKTKKLIFKQGVFEDSTNNIGEFLALVHALAHMKKVNDKRPIYSDSSIAIAWVRDRVVRTKNPQTAKNTKSSEMIQRALVWLDENEIPNEILKWETKAWGEIPADFGRK
ncbi:MULTISPECIES: viroplasmin family protein [Labilibaculum]|uniref:Ribonuclease H n=1 Tax=Labilibaculum euxinus TaxID=2686357 RepID=A0A7M4D9V2_9BACT|nr:MULTISPECIES: ribonuclease H family protein [Labilibaculum]MUP39431.1 ribonuclease H [Labilibaculum euxinus]MVB08636.1 ribonuclease H [Labilibaculum euxinus]